MVAEQKRPDYGIENGVWNDDIVDIVPVPAHRTLYGVARALAHLVLGLTVIAVIVGLGVV